MGDGLRRGPPGDRQARRDQGAAPQPVREPQRGGALHPGGARGQPDRASQHRRHLRVRHAAPTAAATWSMEWLRGREPGGAAAARPAAARRGVSRSCCRCCDALEAAHEQRIVHRDLKPDNIVPGRRCKDAKPLVKLLDFGIAKLADSDDTAATNARAPGSLHGHAAVHLARAGARSRRRSPHRLYSLGAMAFEMFCGRPPFVHDSPMELVAAHLHEQPPRPSQLRASVPRELDNLLLATAREGRRTPPLACRCARRVGETESQTPSLTPSALDTSFAYEPTEAATSRGAQSATTQRR